MISGIELILALSQVILPVTLIGPPLLASLPRRAPNVQGFAIAIGLGYVELAIFSIAIAIPLIGEQRWRLLSVSMLMILIAGVSLFIAGRYVIHHMLAAPTRITRPPDNGSEDHNGGGENDNR